MFELMKKTFFELLTGILIASNHAKCVSLSNQKRMAQSTLINLHPNEYSREFHYYPFAVKLDVLKAVIPLKFPLLQSNSFSKCAI